MAFDKFVVFADMNQRVNVFNTETGESISTEIEFSINHLSSYRNEDGTISIIAKGPYGYISLGHLEDGKYIEDNSVPPEIPKLTIEVELDEEGSGSTTDVWTVEDDPPPEEEVDEPVQQSQDMPTPTPEPNMPDTSDNIEDMSGDMGGM